MNDRTRRLFTITEQIEIEIYAETAQDAIDTWLTYGEHPGASVSVLERDCFDENGAQCAFVES